MPPFTLRVRDFRVLERLDWSPEGVCVLSGCNGAGKSTTLDAFRFLRELFSRGTESAFVSVDGGAFKRLAADNETPVEISLEVGDLTWKLRFPMSDRGVKGTYGEELHRGDQVVLRAAMLQDVWYLGQEKQPIDEQRCCVKVLWDRERPDWMKPLVELLEEIRIFGAYRLDQVKRVEQSKTTRSFLQGDGRNLWSVLANWKAAPLINHGQFEWVMAEVRRAFPGIIRTIEFDQGFTYIFQHDSTDPAEGLSPNRAADGVLTGLLHLTAVAGAKNGSLLAFDEIENQMHPHAIRSVIAAMRRQAEERDLTIVLTTHSPVVLNQFRAEPEQVYVLGHGKPDLNTPARMTDLHDEIWLAQDDLGSFYERLAFAAPVIGGDDA